MKRALLRTICVLTVFLVFHGCSDGKMRQRVAAMNTETLKELSTQYSPNSKEARLIADELSRRPRKTTAPAPKPARTSPSPSKTIAPLPTYQIVDRDKYDAPVKTQIEIHAVVSGNITEPSLKALLRKLYNEARAKRGFKYHGGKATHVFIYLYASHAHFESGMGQWLGMLSKIGDNKAAEIEIRPNLITQRK